jgi:hypothetical protein
MKAYDNHWPSSWGDLLAVLDSTEGRTILLRGAQAGDLEYARSLQNQIAIDWTFDPRNPDEKHPVTRLDGRPFPVVWQDPNEMIRQYLSQKPATKPST